MSSDIERWEPPNDPIAFESLCLDLWKDIWQDSGAQKNGRRGQRQDGVDIFGHEKGQVVGVQCKQKDGRLWATLTEAELEHEVEAARRFEPNLAKFILATTAPRDATLQRKANQLTEQHRQQKLFAVEVWAWEDLWHELYRRYDLLQRIARIYWPQHASLPPPPPSLAGSGKSTFLSYLSLCLAKHHLEPNGKWLERLEGWPADACWIPMTVVLRDFVRDCALKFAERFRHSRLVVTCRTLPYQAMVLKEADSNLLSR